MSSLSIRTICPYCGLKERRPVAFIRYLTNAHISGRDTLIVTPNVSSARAMAASVFCDECRYPYSIMIHQGANATIQGIVQSAGNDVSTDANLTDALILTFPANQTFEVDTALPKEIRQPFADIQEDAAKRRNAPGVMGTARACLDVALKELGETTGGRIARIKNLQSKGILTSALADWANKLWEDGNDAVHDLKATHESASEHVQFLKLFFEVVFVLPQKIAAAKVGTTAPP